MFSYFYLIYHYFNKFWKDNNVIQMQIAFSYHVSNYDVKEHFLYFKCSTFTQSLSELQYTIFLTEEAEQSSTIFTAFQKHLIPKWIQLTCLYLQG